LIYRFEDFSLDGDRRELRRGSEIVAIEPQVFDVLEFLIANRERVVSNDGLIQAVWQGRIVSDGTVSTRINAVRHALGDSGAHQRLIRTLPRKGYRFAGVIRPESGNGKPSDLATPIADVPLILPDKPSIAVLPFVNMSGDPEQEYFTDGLTEDILTELSRFHSLFVIARDSSFAYKGKSPDTRQVGRELGVRYVLEGSIRKSSNRIRVTGQLIDTLTGNHIWAERYDRVLEDIFAVQEEVTRAIVAAITPQIETTEQLKAARPRPGHLSAYEMALRARAHLCEAQDKEDRTILEQSIREAKQALAIDPNCVTALHALAWDHGHALFLGWATDREHALQQAMWATTRAIELDSADAHGYALRAGGIIHRQQWDRYAEALADARRAHEMNPNDTTILRILGFLEALAGEPERGIEHLHQVMRLNPRDPHSHHTQNTIATACFGAKRYAEGIDWSSRALRDRPKMISAYSIVVLNFVGAGEVGKAKAMFETLQKLAPEYVRSRLKGTWAYGRPEDRRRATTFIRIAAGLEDPSSADALR
jgi:adenylate cyclase